MTANTATGYGFDSLHDELDALLITQDERSARSHYCAALRRRGLAGAIFFQANPASAGRVSRVNALWDEDFSGELDEESPSRVLSTAIEKIPQWLVSWLLSRTKPFWFFHYARFIPFSARLIVDSSAPPGKRQVADFVLTPYLNGADRIYVLSCLHEHATPELVRELSTLSLAYAACAVAELRTRDPIDRSRPEPTRLSSRQLECLQWLAAGKTLSEIATITGMSYANVRYHLERAKSDNGYATTQQLLVHAARSHNLSPFGPDLLARV
jgi:DNA-binding CsgD family transcriptional regulator